MLKKKNSSGGGFLAAIFLFIFNSVIIAPIYLGGFTKYTSSIEPAFITDAKFIALNFPNIGWNPFWYGGFPFHLSYPPAVPFLVAGLNVIFGLPFVDGYRLLVAICYSITPVMIYFLLRFLTGKNPGAIVGALIYSVVPSLLLPGNLNRALPIDLALLVIYGEGPHIVALAFVPISLVLFLKAIRKRTPSSIVLACLSIAMVFLSELIAAFALALILIAFFAAEFLKSEGRRVIRRKVVNAGLVVLTVLGLTAFWYNFSFLRSIYDFAGVSGPLHSSIYPSFALAIGLSIALLFAFRRDVEKRKSIFSVALWVISALLIALSYFDFGLDLLVSIVLLVMVTGGLALAYRGNIPQKQPLFIGIVWSIIFLVIILAGESLNLNLAPQANRYFPELMMGISVLVAIVAQLVYEQLRAWMKRPQFLAFAVLISLLFFAAVSVATIPPSWNITTPNSNFKSGPIYTSAEYIGTHTNGNHRVFETSSYAFWLNVFANVPQIRGGSDQASVNSKWWNQVMYQILYGNNPTLSVKWLEAFNVQYVVTYTNDAARAYFIHQDYYNPFFRNYTYDQFSGILPLVSNSSGTMIYEVPSGSSFVSIVNANQVLGVGTIQSVTDSQGISNYLNASTPKGDLTYTYPNPDTIVIKGDYENSSVGVLVKMNYDTAWIADTLNGTNVPIVQDPIGFMLLKPGSSGNLTIMLHYTVAPDVGAGYAITAVTFATMISVFVYEWTIGHRKNRDARLQREEMSQLSAIHISLA